MKYFIVVMIHILLMINKGKMFQVLTSHLHIFSREMFIEILCPFCNWVAYKWYDIYVYIFLDLNSS